MKTSPNAYSGQNTTRVSVPIEQLTDGELLTIAKEYESKSHCVRAHAEEIRDFVFKRKGKSKSA